MAVLERPHAVVEARQGGRAAHRPSKWATGVFGQAEIGLICKVLGNAAIARLNSYGSGTSSSRPSFVTL